MTHRFQRPALDVLAELRRGRLHAELTDAMHDLIAAATDTGKKAELVLKLTFEPDPDDPTRMKVSDQLAAKTPRRTVKPSLFFLTDDGNLTRTDPNQQEPFDGLREVPDTSVEDTTTTTDRKAN